MSDKIVVEFIGKPMVVQDGHGRRRIEFTCRALDALGIAALPNIHNPREPNIKRHAAARDMMAQLREAPGSFFMKNKGVELGVDKATVGASHVSFEVNELTGKVNGAHTSACIIQSREDGVDLTDVRVKVIIHEGYTTEELLDISKGSNTQVAVKRISFANQEGLFDAIKEYLPTAWRSRISFKENDPEAPHAPYDGVDVARMLLVMDPVMFPPGQKVPDKLYSSKSQVFKLLEADSLQKVYPLTYDVIMLHQRVVRYFVEHNGHNVRGQRNRIPLSDHGKRAGEKNSAICRPMTTIQGEVFDITPPNSLVLMAMAAFRRFIDGSRWYDGGEATLPELWERYGERICRATWETFKEAGEGMKFDIFGKVPSHWKLVDNAAALAAR